ncbi:hypothetical protein HQ447_14375 [bacterium]|nr:hypothetical protein [bacterium]
MKTMSLLEIDQHWPEAQKVLKSGCGIVVTRDGETVGRLVPMEVEEEKPRKRFDAEEHRRWMEEMWGGETFDTLTPLMESREDRKLI